MNVIGCLVIGILGGVAENVESFNPSLRLFLFLGILGGFTTFSSFGYDSVSLIRNGQMQRMMANVLMHIVFGFGAVWVGYSLGSWRAIAID